MELTTQQREFLLVPKALPTSSHYANLRQVLPRTKWDKLRKLAYERANHMCELCHGKPPRLEAHELWRFDFDLKIQYLERVVALCSKCHAMQHALLLRLQHDQGIKNAQVVVNHYNKLNNVKITFDKFFAIATNEHNKYEKIFWDVVVVKEFDDLLQEL